MRLAAVAARSTVPAATRDAYPALLAAAEPEVRTRIRIAHKRTQRDGWDFETTVEVEYAGGTDEDAGVRLAVLLAATAELGRAEADARNAVERLRRQDGDA